MARLFAWQGRAYLAEVPLALRNPDAGLTTQLTDAHLPLLTDVRRLSTFSLLFFLWPMSLTTPCLLPPNERARLHSLRACHMADAPCERVFTELAELSAQVFGLPVALLSMVEARRVVYKAAHGLAQPTPQPRAATLCALVVRENKSVVLTDVASAQHPSLTPAAECAARLSGLRFYAGAPLRRCAAHSLGALCVLGYQPRAFSTGEQHLLEQVAHVASLVIAARCTCLADQGFGALHWEVVEAQLAEEVRALGALVRYLLTRPRPELALPLLVLDHVERRLRDVRELLDEYQPHLPAKMPLAVSPLERGLE